MQSFQIFAHFQAGSVDFERVVVKRCVCGIFKSDAHHSARFKGDMRSLPFQNQTLRSVTLRDVSSTCPKPVLNYYKSPCLFYECSETKVEATALSSVSYSLYLYIRHSNLFSLLSHTDIL